MAPSSRAYGAPVRIGLFLGEPRSDDPIGELTGWIRQADDDGFASAWVPQIFGLDALTALAAAGRGTTIELGTGVVPTYPRHPMMLAQQALTANAAIDGRLALGIGLSHKPVVEGMWGISFAQPARHMEEYLSVLLTLTREGYASFDGEAFRVHGRIQVPGARPFPILVAALGPRMLHVAGSLADGTVTWMTGVRTLADHIVPTITKAASEAGRDVRVVHCLQVCVTDDVDAGREAAATAFAGYGSLPSYRAMLDREGAQSEGDVAIVGDEAAVRAGIERSADAGATDFVAVPVGDRAARSRTRALLKTLL
jgi:F420-dependent oxidoreductase-like protein